MEIHTIINIFLFVLTVHNPTCVLAGLLCPFVGVCSALGLIIRVWLYPYMLILICSLVWTKVCCVHTCMA